MRLNCELVNDEVRLLPNCDLSMGDIYLNWALENVHDEVQEYPSQFAETSLAVCTGLCGSRCNMTPVVLCNW